MTEPIRYGVTKRWSDAVVVGNLGFFVEVPDDPNLPPHDQFQMVLEQVDQSCRKIGTNRRHLVQVLVYLPFPEDLELFNRLWDEWIPHGCAPTRACTHPALAAPGYRVELVVTAYVPGA
jgi:enamine deaminase RidA (YjgF/YER057c/UK114 family)